MEIVPTAESNFKSDAFITLTTTLLYMLLNFVLSSYGPVSNHVASTGKHLRWFNIMTSWVNSIVIGIGAVYCFSLFPDMSEFTFSKHHAASHFMVSIYLGYLIYDTIDELRKPQLDWMMLFHHLLGYACCGSVLSTHRFASVFILGMLAECNSFFLHARQLMNLSHVSHDSLMYKLNSIINIITFVVFRLGTAAWILIWFAVNKSKIPLIHAFTPVLCTCLWFVGNVFVLHKIISIDFNYKQNSAHVQNLNKKNKLA